MHRLSSYIELLKEVDVAGTNQYFVIVTKQGSKFFVINEVIYLFLEQFQEPTTLGKVTNVFAEQLKITSGSNDFKKLQTQLTEFHTSLLKKKWIVDVNTEEKEYALETLFKENDSFLNYNVKKVLANNKITDVYLVSQTKTKKKLVVKLLNSKKFTGVDSFERAKRHFKAEYDFCARFNSNYINKAEAYIYFDKQPLLVLSLIKGESIRRFVQKNRLLKEQKHKLVLKLLKGFSIIHDAGVYHGDIHFSNVLITKNHQAKIIDFGYSNSAKLDAGSVVKKPRNGGVYAFIPPERALRSINRRFTEVVQYQSEVYQIGLIVYFIYLKNLPFKAITWKTMVDEKKEFNINTFEPFVKRRMPLAVRNFITKSLATNSKDRFVDAKDMYNAWKRVI